VELGYRGYPEMQKALQEVVRARLTSVQRIQAAEGQLGGEQDVVSLVLQQDIHTLRMTNDALDRKALDACLDAIIGARNIYILGVRSSAVVAEYMNFYLRIMLDNVHMVSPAASELMEQLLHIGPEDVVLGVSMPRYSPYTVQAMHFARKSGCTCIAITDNHQAPLAQICDHVLIAKSEMVSFVDPLVAPMSVVGALIVALSHRLGMEFSRKMAELESLWSEYDVYERQDL